MKEECYKREEQILYILDSNKENQVKNKQERVAVVINLYYRDTIDRYINYVRHIPNNIPIYICSSDAFVLESVKSKLHRENFFCIEKNNRGRDISAFLVAAKDVIKSTDFFCFIHDKSPNATHLREDVEIWIENLWENTLASGNYIQNVIAQFKEDEQLGLLVPPAPYGEFYSDWYGNTWGSGYEVTKELATRLNLCTEISFDAEVRALSTVFWARTNALKKLLDYPWTYEDFPQEPLPADGTLNHAIERILGFVAQDAGYQTATIMTTEYAQNLLLRAQKDMRVMFGQLRKREHVLNLHHIKNLDVWERNLEAFCKAHKYIYVYGAGLYGKNIAEFIADRNWKLCGFVVSGGHKTEPEVLGFPVLEIRELTASEEVGVVIGASYEYRAEIRDTLERYGISDYMDGF